MNSQVVAERKFVASPAAAAFAKEWVSHCCLPDPEFPFGRISSIYYDTPKLDSYFEKSNGDFLKTKVRLRWYDNAPPQDGKQTAFLELKFKIGGGRQKARRSLTVDASWLRSADLQDEKFRVLLYEQLTNLEEPLSSNLFPTFRLYYERRRFICPVSLARVCLDTAIGYDRVNTDLFASVAPGHLDYAILEIKDVGAGAETPWLEEIHRAGFYNQNFSKYAQCIAGLVRRRSV